MKSTRSCDLYIDLSELQSRSQDDLESHVENVQNSPADGLVLDLYRTEHLVSTVYSLDQARTMREYQLERTEFLDLHRAYHSDTFEVLARVYDPELVRWYSEETSSERIVSHGGDITFKRLLGAMNKAELEVLLTVKASQRDTVERALTWLSDTEATLLHEEYESEPETLARYNVLRNHFEERIGLADPSGRLARTDAVPSCTPSYWIPRFSAEPDQRGWSLEDLDQIQEELDKINSKTDPPAPDDEPISFTQRDREYQDTRRRSLMADQSLSAGSILSRDMIRELRPAEGLPAEEIDQIIGMMVPRPTDPQEMISY